MTAISPCRAATSGNAISLLFPFTTSLIAPHSLYSPKHSLSGGVVSSADGIVQTIHLLPEDVLAIKKTPGLMRSKQSTYLIISAAAATDLAGNAVVPFIDGLALACKTYIPDEDPPYVIHTLLVGDALEERIEVTPYLSFIPHLAGLEQWNPLPSHERTC